MSTGASIRERRKALGISQTELAIRAGIGVRTVERAESGTHRTSPLALRALADALGVDIDSFDGHPADGEAGCTSAHPPNGGGASDEAAA